MEVAPDEVSYSCVCGKFTGSWEGARGHRARSTDPICRQSKPRPTVNDKAVLESLRVAGFNVTTGDGEIIGEDDEEEVPALEPATQRVGTGKVSTIGAPGRGRKSQPGLGPTAVTEKISFRILCRVMYDAYRMHFDFKGNFNEFIEHCLFDYWDRLGFRLTLNLTQTVPQEEPEAKVTVAHTGPDGERQVLALTEQPLQEQEATVAGSH